MSLPPGFLDELRNRVSIASVIGRAVTWDMRKSKPGKGDMWAPCPFHQEKSASFHVDDKKGFYYCFGCHAKGDALTFLRESQNLNFMEAVEILAREAGMTMPARDPAAAQKADRRAQLVEVTEAAARFFRMQLSTAAATEARAYLEGRGLSRETVERFGLGFAPDARQALWTHLTGAGVAPDLIIDAGLAARADDGGAPFDRFRGRIIFPIRDLRDRCIAFGGRALSANARAKYLNSPETELFDKGRSLYNAASARAAMSKGPGPLIVAEGYMDVIALSVAGFGAAVAPLGTAITEDQLRLLWRLSPEPVVALDGDKAGLRAAWRLIDVALPLIGPEQSLRFVMLPEGQDPDDLLRAGGAGAMRNLLDGALPLVRLLWQRETEGQVLDSPERRAALDARLRAALGRITDQSLRGHYAEELRRLRYEAFAPARGPRAPQSSWRGGGGMAGGRRRAFPAAPLAGTRGTLLAAGPDDAVADHLHEAIILAVLIAHPAHLPDFEPALERAEMRDAGHERLRLILLEHVADPGNLRGRLAERAGDALDALLSIPHVRIAPPVRPDADPELVRACLEEEFAMLSARRGALAETREAMEDLTRVADEGVTWRLGQAAAARHRTERSGLSDTRDLGEDRSELSQRLQELIDKQVWVKRKR
ncbi:DNA primase [Rhodobacteraceae bacterium 2376]|uniref:DNA primase n=1 Tax=Rhabdonatronobacter sediminivivens TaxID=2743469 RepID=A0A7Z0KYG2_9RHOB|nr:DNA primase [Rhabdonatronobacter sediminivivens]NYS25175.1 DNA primase [Rhabdonatronobacter sediminivivens]